jgi:hypothetical protein
MTSPESDLESRLAVWDELQMIFMRTDPALFLGSMADACARSPYTIEEIEEILFNEVLPACRFNLLSAEWPKSQGFDPEWLKTRILKKHRSAVRGHGYFEPTRKTGGVSYDPL